MKHGTKELLKTIIANQELMMKALNIQPVKKEAETKATTKAKAPARPIAKKPVKKAAKKVSGK